MAADLCRGIFPRALRCQFPVGLQSTQRSCVFRQRNGGVTEPRRACSRTTAQGSRSDSSYESFLEERAGRKSSRQNRGPTSSGPSNSKDQSYYSEWDDEDESYSGDQESKRDEPRQTWGRNDDRDQGNRRNSGQPWRGHGGDQRGGRKGPSQSWKSSRRGGEDRSNRPRSTWKDSSSRGARGRSDWGDNRRGGSWSNDENEEQSFKLREQIVGELIYGVSPVTGALKAWRRQVHKLYVQEGLQPKKRKEAHAVDDAISKAGALGVGVEYVTKHDLNMVVDNRPHQGLALDCSPLEYVPLLELPRASTYAGSKPPVWLALDEVKDPQNLGAIIRSAYFLGTTGIIVSAKNSASLSAAVSKVSAGVMEFFPVHSCVKMQQFLVEAQERGWLVVGAAASPDATPCGEFRPTKPVVLVVGNEGYGLRTTVKQACEAFVKIESAAPEANKEFQLDSLNVSVATGILLHSLIVAAKQAPVESS